MKLKNEWNYNSNPPYQRIGRGVGITPLPLRTAKKYC